MSISIHFISILIILLNPKKTRIRQNFVGSIALWYTSYILYMDYSTPWAISYVKKHRVTPFSSPLFLVSSIIIAFMDG